MIWNGYWIWLENHQNTQNFYMYARKTFELGASVRNASAVITCSTEYELYINGKYIGRGPNPCDPKWQYYDEYRLKDALQPGTNVIAVVAHNVGVGTHCRPQTPGGFLFQLDCTLRDGSEIQIMSDESWRVTPADCWDFGSKQMFWTIGFQEIFDSRKEPTGWKEAGFGDSSWQKPYIIGKPPVKPWEHMVKRQIPMLKEYELRPIAITRAGYAISPEDSNTLDPATLMVSEVRNEDETLTESVRTFLDSKTIRVEKSGSFVTFDFGHEVIGYPKIKIASSSGGTIDIGYSEFLDKNGNVEPTRQHILQADRLILRGGDQSFRTFGRRAFRYIQLSFRDLEGPVEIEDIAIDRVAYPVERISDFKCSDETLNRIWETGIHTLTVAMQDQYEDCPIREHGQYPGDSRIDALINYYVFGDTKLAAKGLWQLVQNQREDGFFNTLWPSGTNHALPDYNLIWVMMLRDYHDFCAGQLLLEKLFPNLERLMDVYYPSQEGDSGLLVYYPKPDILFHEWWLFIDHAPLDKRGEVTAYNDFYYKALTDAWILAARAHQFEHAERWRERAKRVRQSINECLWDEKKGVYADCRADGELSDTVSEQANYMAILFDIADDDRTKRILEYMDSKQPVVRSSGPYFNFFILEALAKVGRYQHALDMIRREWGGMLDRGATSWWETFDVNTPKDFICPDGLCHAWGAGPTYWLMKHVAGIRLPDETSRRPYKQTPHLCDLEWVEARMYEVEVEVTTK